eukprot:4237638-Amphidinium_carterae.1
MGVDRLYKAKEDEPKQLFMRVADEYERVYKHFNTNDEIGNMRPTATETHVMTKIKKLGYEGSLRSKMNKPPPHRRPLRKKD